MCIQEIISDRLNGLQVRVGQGPGQTKYLAYKKHGGVEATWGLARKTEKELEAQWGKRARGVGIFMANNQSGIPGLRFEWREYSDNYAYLYLVGNYTDVTGRSRAFAYSVNKHGFEEVLRRGLEIRQKHGAPALALKDAKKMIWAHY